MYLRFPGKDAWIISECLVPLLVAPSVCLDIVHFLNFVPTKLPDPL